MTLHQFPDDAEFTDHGDKTGTFRWQTDFEDAGRYEGTLYATDGENQITRPVAVIISNFNRLPELIHPLSEIILDEDPGETVLADLDTVFMDMDGQNLLYRAFCDCEELNLRIMGNQLICRPERNFNLPDGVQVDYSAHDPEPSSVDSSFTLIIRPVNDPPEAFSLLSPRSGTAFNDLSFSFEWQPASNV